MILERVARAMTEGGPGPGFTARVMAPIHGRPQPGFTARVMAGLDAPRPRTGVRTLRPALIAAGAVAIVVSAALWLPAGLSLPAAPDAPRIAARPYDRELIGIPPLPYNRWAPEIAASPRQTVRATPVVPGAPVAPVAKEVDAIVTTIYRIEPLAPPRELAIAAIDPPAAAVPRLAPVPPIRVSDLRLEKENP